jgi:HTH-type transcriptional regulator, transcriptional repressor of NAD biosynthesis genes
MFDTVYVPEMARLVVEHTDNVSYNDLKTIISLHTREIQYKIKYSNKLLFIDTDYHITRSYSNFLFNKELKVSHTTRDVHK